VSRSSYIVGNMSRLSHIARTLTIAVLGVLLAQLAQIAPAGASLIGLSPSPDYQTEFLDVYDADISVSEAAFGQNPTAALVDSGSVLPNRQLTLWARTVGDTCEDDITISVTAPGLVGRSSIVSPFEGCTGPGLHTRKIVVPGSAVGQWEVAFQSAADQAGVDYIIPAVRLDATDAPVDSLDVPLQEEFLDVADADRRIDNVGFDQNPSAMLDDPGSVLPNRRVTIWARTVASACEERLMVRITAPQSTAPPVVFQPFDGCANQGLFTHAVVVPAGGMGSWDVSFDSLEVQVGADYEIRAVRLDATDEPVTELPDSPPASVATVAVAMGDSFISGEGHGTYDWSTSANPWHGSVEDEKFCDRSLFASIHVADLPGIDESHNVSCSGATPSAISGRSGARLGVAPQTTQLREIAADPGKRVELIQFSIGGNNEDFFFGKLVAACVGGFVLDGYTHTGAASGFPLDDWYGYLYNMSLTSNADFGDYSINPGGPEKTFGPCTSGKYPTLPEGAQLATIEDLIEAVAALESRLVAAGTHPDDNNLRVLLSSYRIDLQGAWFAPRADHIPMASLPYPQDVADAMNAWILNHGSRATRIGDAEQTRALRLLHEWEYLRQRTIWESHPRLGADLEPIDYALTAWWNPYASGPIEQLFPPSFRGEYISREEFQDIMWIPQTGIPDPLVLQQADGVARELQAVINTMASISDVDGQPKYPDGSYRIVVQDYTSPITTDVTDELMRENGKTDASHRFKRLVRERYAAGCPFHRDTGFWAAEQADLLSEMISLAFGTVAAAPENEGVDLVRLDVRDALDGGRLCDGTSPSTLLVAPVRFAMMGPSGQPDVLHEMTATTTAGLRSADQFDERCLYWAFQYCQTSAHPNRRGSAAIGECLSAAWLSVDAMVDCDRVNNVIEADGVVVTEVIIEPQVNFDAVAHTHVPNQPCSTVSWSRTFSASLSDPDDVLGGVGQWEAAVTMGPSGTTVSAGSASGTWVVSGTAPCAFDLLPISVRVTAVGPDGSAAGVFQDTVDITPPGGGF